MVYSPFVLIMVLLLWLPFRAGDWPTLVGWLQELLIFEDYNLADVQGFAEGYSWLKLNVLMLTILVFFAFEAWMGQKDFNVHMSNRSKGLQLTIYYLLLIMIILLGEFSVKPSFIYFQF